MNARKSLLTLGAAVIGVMVLGWGVLIPKSLHAAPGGILTGTVKSASGEKLNGATVSARLDGSTITTSVFTDEQGNYYFPAMDAGKYHVWAQVETFQAGKADVELNATRHQDFALAPLKNYAKQLSSDELFASMPESTQDEKRLKHTFKTSCTSCHQPEYIFQNRFDEDGWTAIMNLMMHISVTGPFVGLDA